MIREFVEVEFTYEIARKETGFPELIGMRGAMHNWNMRNGFEMVPACFPTVATLIIKRGVLKDIAPEIACYDTYKNSALWKRIRIRIFARAKGRCACCEELAQQVHHRDYRPSVLRGNNDKFLIALCETCHTTVHAADPKYDDWCAQERKLLALYDFNQKEKSG